MPKKTRVAVVDDHPVVRRGISETFAEAQDFEVIGEGASADDAVSLVRDRKPHLVLLDVTLPGGGVEAVAEIRKLSPETAIIMVSIREDLATVRAALRAGASGYVSKGIDGEELVITARKVLAGHRYVCPDLAAKLVFEEDASPASPAGAPERAELTSREQQILKLVGAGRSNQEIGDALGLSENTVKHYITPMLRKLGVRNRTEAALLIQAGSLFSAPTRK